MRAIREAVREEPWLALALVVIVLMAGLVEGCMA